MQVDEQVGVGLDYRDAAVGDAPCPAERLHVGLRFAEPVAGHGGEEVVLDLVVEAAEHPVP